MKTLPEMFPNASQSTLERNPHLSVGKAKKNDSSAILKRKRGDVECPSNQLSSPNMDQQRMGRRAAPTFNPKGRGIMNKTEAEFSLMLEAQKRNGEILRYEYEGITLRWAGIRYTPDFVVFVNQIPSMNYAVQIKLIEVKGPWIKGKFERAVERFRHARTYWPEFGFELWQKTKEGWIRKQ